MMMMMIAVLRKAKRIPTRDGDKDDVLDDEGAPEEPESDEERGRGAGGGRVGQIVGAIARRHRGIRADAVVARHCRIVQPWCEKF
jgi:lactate dehydrogenase-like 2-hydroxyacid dehydrogenase